MAAPTTLKFGKLVVYLEDQATPGTYAAPCGFTEKSFSISKDLTDVTVPDCADPDAPAWVGREVASLSWSVTGSGVLALEALEEWRTFAESSLARNVRVEITTAVGAGGGYWQGKAHLSSFEVSATLGEKIQISVSLESDESAIWTNL